MNCIVAVRGFHLELPFSGSVWGCCFHSPFSVVVLVNVFGFRLGVRCFLAAVG